MTDTGEEQAREIMIGVCTYEERIQFIAAALRGATERAAEIQMNAWGWMRCHDQLKAWIDKQPGLLKKLIEDDPRDKLPSSADLPNAVAGARLAALALLRNPTSDMLNSAADDIRREIDPLQNRAKYLLEGAADHIERALAESSPAAPSQGRAEPPREGGT